MHKISTAVLFLLYPLKLPGIFLFSISSSLFISIMHIVTAFWFMKIDNDLNAMK